MCCAVVAASTARTRGLARETRSGSLSIVVYAGGNIDTSIIVALIQLHNLSSAT